MQMKVVVMSALIAVVCVAFGQNPNYATSTGNAVKSGFVWQDFQNTAAWTSSDGTISSDPSNVMIGNQSLMLTANPGNDAHMRLPIYTNFSTVTNISLWVYAQYPLDTDFAGWHAASIYLTSDNFQDYFLATTQNLHPGWSKLTFSKNDFVPYGKPNWSSTMTTLQLALFGDTSQGMSVSFADMELNGTSRPKVIIAFDDNYASSYSYGYEYLKKYGFSGTEFVISSMVDQMGRTTSAQLQEMYDYGWDMCNHTNTHPDLRTLTQAQVVSEYSICEQFLIGKGWTRNQGYRHLAYPYGYFNDTVLAADSQFGLLTARTTMETVPQAPLLDSKYQLYSQVPDSQTQTADDIIASVDQVVADGGTLEITFHNITPTPQVAIDFKDTDFEKVIDYVAAEQQRGKLDVETFTQWYNAVAAQQTISYFQTNAPQSAVGVPNQGLIYLAAPASSPLTVTLISRTQGAAVPSSVVIPAGSSQVSFPIRTLWVNSPTVVSLYAGLNGVTTSCTFTVLPTAPSRLTLSASTVKGGSSVSGAVWLNGPSPTGGCTVNVTCNIKGATVSPSSVFVPAGWTHGVFSLNTTAVKKATTGVVTASYNGGSKTISVTVD